jgi:site-specific DNA-methyltransferase (adenine-specific)
VVYKSLLIREKNLENKTEKIGGEDMNNQEADFYLEFKHQSILLYNESCFDFLAKIPDDSIQLVLIDPPYEISRDAGFIKGGGVERFAVSMDFGDWDKNFDGFTDVIKECFRVLKKGGTLLSFYDLWKITTLKEYMEKAGFKQLRFAEWIKTNPVPINSKVNYLTNAREIILSGVKGSKPTFNSQYHNGVYSHPICHEKGRFHPNQKPLKLIKELVSIHSNEQDVILDCFSGSGTTAIACIEMNRKFIGCELDKGYYEKSIERIEEKRKEKK